MCSQHREPLVESQEYFARNLVAGGIGGAVIGGIAGALLSKNRAKGALIGAGVGALAGVAGAYLKSKADQAKDKKELRAAINTDAGKDNFQLNKFSDALNRLNGCRADQLARLKADFKAGRVKEPEARKRLADIRAAMAKDADLVGEVLDDAEERNHVYADSAAKVDDVDRSIVLAKAEAYQPKVNRRPSGGGAKSLPRVQAKPRPKANTAIQAAEIKRKEVKAEFEAQQQALDDDARDVLFA